MATRMSHENIFMHELATTLTNAQFSDLKRRINEYCRSCKEIEL